MLIQQATVHMEIQLIMIVNLVIKTKLQLPAMFLNGFVVVKKNWGVLLIISSACM